MITHWIHCDFCLKCCGQNGLTCPISHAYHLVFRLTAFLRRRIVMVTRRSLTLASAGILIFSAALFAQTTPQPRKLTDAEKKEIQAVQKIVDDAAGGQSAPNEVGLAWVHEDLLKAQGNKQYLPFSVSIDPSKVSGNKLTFYWRV